MPGLFGFLQLTNLQDSAYMLQNMSKAIKDQDWYQVDLYQEERLGLGRVSMGLFHQEMQPIWNEDRTLCIVMEGEIFDYKDLKQKLVDRGHCFKVDNDAEFILHLYEEFENSFASYLNGAFVAAIWNRLTGELVLVNDHIGSRPLYYAMDNCCFAFASGVRALLTIPTMSCKIDHVAIAQMLAFEFILQNRTLLCNVKLLPPASVLTFKDGQLSIRPHWQSLRFAECYEKRSEEDYLEGLIYHLRQAVSRQLPGDLSAGLNLSGGLDSRMLLGLLKDRMPEGSLRTFTFGISRCDDARFANELATAVRAQHQFLELRPDYLIEMADEVVRLTDGMESCIHAHARASLNVQAESVRVLYTGYLIDSLIGPDGDRTWLANIDENLAVKILFDDLNKSFLFRPEQRANLLTPAFQRHIDGAFEESFRSVAIEAKSTSSVLDWQNNVDLLQRQRRFTAHGTELLRSQLIARTPFCDKDLAKYCLALPTGLRFERYVFIKAIALAYRDLAKVPWDKTGFPLTECRRDLLLRFDKQTRSRLRDAGFKKIPVKEFHPYVDYNHWLRTALRSWVEAILLDKHSLERGYFNPHYVRKIVAEHMAGENHANRLGILLSLELWHRQFID